MADLDWSVHPARRRPIRAAVAVAVVAITATFAAFVGRNPGWGLAAAVFLCVSIATFLFPTSYRLSADGLEVRVLGAKRRRRWSDLRLESESSEGILLAPRSGVGLLHPVRAIFLRYPQDAEAVRRFVQDRLG